MGKNKRRANLIMGHSFDLLLRQARPSSVASVKMLSRSNPPTEGGGKKNPDKDLSSQDGFCLFFFVFL